MRRILGISARVLGGLTLAFALFALGAAGSILMLGISDVYADDTVVEHHESYKSERVVESAPAVIEKRTKVEEKRTTVEAVPAPKVVERRTVEVVPAPAVIEKRTVETVEDD